MWEPQSTVQEFSVGAGETAQTLQALDALQRI